MLLIFMILSPSAFAVMISPGVPNETSVTAGTTIIFQDVSIIIRGTEAVPVNYLEFVIYDIITGHKVAKVHFSLEGDKISGNPKELFTVTNITDTSNLPYQTKGNYYGYDERTGENITGFHSGYGYGYGYGYNNFDITIIYTITYKTCEPGTYYAKFYMKTPKHRYESWESIPFTVLPESPLLIHVDIEPSTWPNKVNPRNQGYISIAVCGTDNFDVNRINPKTLMISLSGRKYEVKTPHYEYKDLVTPWTGVDGGGHSSGADGYDDILLRLRIEQVIHVLKLFKHPDEILILITNGFLKKNRSL